ncbi:MAG: DUF4229 domain-containing protein [Gordonia sp. (in: high G+C Gram-positive bacteria)]|uniref:DUF4229 domain-containing protein n=1 Tax=Gordonia sp. (in: high G+C Gram-positive bacteria) TaxID=84139 RepID=UPI003BB66B3F
MTDQQVEPTDNQGNETKASIGSLVGWIALYTLVRMGLVAIVAVIIFYVGKAAGVTVPVLAAALFGVVIALPLGMFVFKTIRLKVNEQISLVDADRASRKSDLHARLRGDED